jgi:hypothetical protein
MYIITRRKYFEVPISNNATILIREETCRFVLANFWIRNKFHFWERASLRRGGEYVLQQEPEIVIEIVIGDT